MGDTTRKTLKGDITLDALSMITNEHPSGKIKAMALIFRGKTECVLCNEVMKENDEIIATSHFIADTQDALWRFSDAAMHKNCFLEWDQRQTFVDRYNDAIGINTWGNGRYHHMNDDGEIVAFSRENQENE
jgi:hypothetical protein